MADKELLEMAAKAAGIVVNANRQAERDSLNLKCQVGLWTDTSTNWNPLTNDGDALRLLAVLPSLWGLSLKFGTPSIKMSVAWGTGRGIEAVEFAGEGVDRATAIRRAIVRAAAEIGKGLPK
ncbi:MAG: hypothetical protein WC236_09710 [Gallionellaceae bacterium]|jgi:hypothetical protein